MRQGADTRSLLQRALPSAQDGARRSFSCGEGAGEWKFNDPPFTYSQHRKLDTVEVMHVERRRSTRLRSVLKAEIRYNNNLMHVPCVIRDISEDGARIDLGGDVAVPGHFELYIEKQNRLRRAVVRWAKNHEAGIAFDDAPQATFDAPIAERIAELEAEISVLRPLLTKRGRRLAALFSELAAASRKGNTH